MGYILDILIIIVQPIGNYFALKVLPKNMIEEDSDASSFIGGIVVVITSILLGSILLSLTG